MCQYLASLLQSWRCHIYPHDLLLFVISQVSPAKVRIREGFRLSLLMIVDVTLNTVRHDNHNLYLKQFQLRQTCKESNLTLYTANWLSAAWRLMIYVSYTPTAFTPRYIFYPSTITVALGASARQDYTNARISFTAFTCPYVRTGKRETTFSKIFEGFTKICQQIPILIQFAKIINVILSYACFTLSICST
jgi:hypothetical protein